MTLRMLYRLEWDVYYADNPDERVKITLSGSDRELVEKVDSLLTLRNDMRPLTIEVVHADV